jgi:hypothetical protein
MSMRVGCNGQGRVPLFFVAGQQSCHLNYVPMLRHFSLMCGLFLFASLAPATQIKVRTIEQLAAAGEAVVHGIVTSKSVQRDVDGRIFTRVQLKLKEHWKGSRPVISIVHGGGVLGDEASFAEGQEQYTVGEEVVAFVRFNGRGEAVTLGMNQGKFTVFKRDGETLVYNGFHGAAPGEATPGRKPIRLEELKSRVLGGAR